MLLPAVLVLLQGAAPERPAVEIGGRLMFDSVFVGGPGAEEVGAALGGELRDGSEIRRARVDVRSEFAPGLRGWLGMEWSGGGARFREASLAWSRAADQEWKFGYFKQPFALDLYGSSNDFDLLEAPLGEDALAPGRHAGLQWSRWSAPATCAAAVYRRQSEAVGASENEGYGAAARGVWRPLFRPEAGFLLHLAADLAWERPDGAVRFSARPEQHLLPVFLDTGSLAADAVLRSALELGWTAGRWHGAAERLAARLDDAASDPSLDGWNVSAGCFLTGESRPYEIRKGTWGRVAPAQAFGAGGGGAWEAVARWSALDFGEAGAGELEVQSLGLVWYGTEHLRVLWTLNRSVLDDFEAVYALGLRLGIDF